MAEAARSSKSREERLARLAEQARDRRARKRAKLEQADRRLGLIPAPASEQKPFASEGATEVAEGPGNQTAEAARPQTPDPSAFLEPCRQLWTAAGKVAAGKDDRLALTSAEVDQLAQASAPVAAKYLPEVASTPEGALAAMVLAICAPKVLAVVMSPKPPNEEGDANGQ